MNKSSFFIVGKHAVTEALINKKRKVTNIVHSRFNLFMDRVFLDVLDKNERITPSIFYNLSSNLSGDEMAKFMLGKSKLITWLKVMIKLPKLIFLFSLISVLINGASNVVRLALPGPGLEAIEGMLDTVAKIGESDLGKKLIAATEGSRRQISRFVATHNLS